MATTCKHFAPHGSCIQQAGYAMMDAYKDRCCWCEIEQLQAALQEMLDEFWGTDATDQSPLVRKRAREALTHQTELKGE